MRTHPMQLWQIEVLGGLGRYELDGRTCTDSEIASASR
jgi:hypothetical protein